MSFEPNPEQPLGGPAEPSGFELLEAVEKLDEGNQALAIAMRTWMLDRTDDNHVVVRATTRAAAQAFKELAGTLVDPENDLSEDEKADNAATLLLSVEDRRHEQFRKIINHEDFAPASPEDIETRRVALADVLYSELFDEFLSAEDQQKHLIAYYQLSLEADLSSLTYAVNERSTPEVTLQLAKQASGHLIGVVSNIATIGCLAYSSTRAALGK